SQASAAQMTAVMAVAMMSMSSCRRVRSMRGSARAAKWVVIARAGFVRAIEFLHARGDATEYPSQPPCQKQPLGQECRGVLMRVPCLHPQSQFFVTAESQITPEPLWVRPNQTISLYADVLSLCQDPSTWAVQRLMESGGTVSPEVTKRVFLGMSWYVRSCREDITKTESLLHLAVALESLFCLEAG